MKNTTTKPHIWNGLIGIIKSSKSFGPKKKLRFAYFKREHVLDEYCRFGNFRENLFSQITLKDNNWAVTWDFQQCGVCDQQRLIPACAYAQSDQSLCLSLKYSMCYATDWTSFGAYKLKGRLHFLFWVYTCQMPHCWKSHAAAQWI